MAAVIIREFYDFARDREGCVASDLPAHPLVTDKTETTIKTLTSSATSQPVVLESGTLVVEIETTVNVRYAITPKKWGSTIIAATANHSLAKAAEITRVRVSGGATISIIDV